MNSEDVKKLNNNLKKNLRENKNMKEEDIKMDIEKVEKKTTKKNVCNKCFLEFNDYTSLEKHKWEKHPVDKYQYFHSNIRDWSNYSLSYRDDPYY